MPWFSKSKTNCRGFRFLDHPPSPLCLRPGEPKHCGGITNTQTASAVLYSWLLHVSTQSEKRRVEKKTCEERRVWENTLRDSAPFYSLPPVDICHSSQGVCGRQGSLENLWKQRKSIRKSNHCQVHCFSKIIGILFLFQLDQRRTKSQ